MNASGGLAAFHRTISAVVVAVVFATVIFFLSSEPAEATNTVAPANDDIRNAEVISGDSAFVRGNNRFATKQKGEPDHVSSGSSVGRNSVWYQWTAWTSGPVEASVCRSNFDTILAVHARNDEGKMEQVADNDDGCSARNHRGSSLVFEAGAEETYWMAVSGYSKASTGVFNLKLSHAPPAGAAE